MIEIFENQRYSLIGGWSNSSLLPAVVDPFAFTTTDSLDGWHTIEEVNRALLSTGWSWIHDSSWTPYVTSSTDPEGWSYSINFSFINEAVAEKGSLHFVRRRTLRRHRDFNGANVLDVSAISDCYCDSEEVDKAALQLLTALSSASHYRHPARVTLAQMNVIKNEFTHTLFLQGDILNMTHEATPETLHSDRAGTPLLPRSANASVHSANDIAIENESIVHKKTPWESISSKIEIFSRKDKSVWFGGLGQVDENIEALIHRTVEVADHHFAYQERSEFARLLIRLHDMDFRYHCDKRVPTSVSTLSGDINSNSRRLCTIDNCIFAPYNCINQDCPVVISRKWREKHDATCMNKAVSCQRNCGEKVIRKLSYTHLATECRLRPVKCPFNDIGCDAELVQAAVSDHLTERVSDHLTLAARRIHEQERSIKTQSTQIDGLNHQYEQQIQLADVVKSGMIAVHDLIEVSERRQRAVMEESITKQEITTTRKLNEVNSTLQLEVNKLTHAVADLHAQLKDMRAVINAKK